MPTSVADLDTPAVVIDLDIVEANIKRAQERSRATASTTGRTSRRTRFRHSRKMQMDAGAVGITCQKLGEVEVMADAGVADDILLTYNVLGEAKTERLVALIRRLKRMAVVVDNERGGARTVGGRQAPRRRHPLPDRVRHGLRPQRRAEPAGGARFRARRDAAAEHAVRRPDDLPDRQARAAALARTRARSCSTAPASRCRSCRAAARPRCKAAATSRC